MNTVRVNNDIYYLVVQVIGRSKTSFYQELCIYPWIELIIYDFYFSMAYTCVMDPNNVNNIFHKFSKPIFKSDESKIYSKLSQVFIKVYKRVYDIVQHYRSSA